jgi:hypothetical protein
MQWGKTTHQIQENMKTLRPKEEGSPRKSELVLEGEDGDQKQHPFEGAV